MACVLRYFPKQATNFVFKDIIKAAIMTREGSLGSKAVVNIVSGGVAGTLCLLPAYSLDYARTRLAADTRGRGGERLSQGEGRIGSLDQSEAGTSCKLWKMDHDINTLVKHT